MELFVDSHRVVYQRSQSNSQGYGDTAAGGTLFRASENVWELQVTVSHYAKYLGISRGLWENVWHQLSEEDGWWVSAWSAHPSLFLKNLSTFQPSHHPNLKTFAISTKSFDVAIVCNQSQRPSDSGVLSDISPPNATSRLRSIRSFWSNHLFSGRFSLGREYRYSEVRWSSQQPSAHDDGIRNNPFEITEDLPKDFSQGPEANWTFVRLVGFAQEHQKSRHFLRNVY